MEINNHINGSELINNTTGQNIFQLKSNVGSEPLYFLQDLYTSPTKINIAWKELETMDSSCEVSNNQLVNSKILDRYRSKDKPSDHVPVCLEMKN